MKFRLQNWLGVVIVFALPLKSVAGIQWVDVGVNGMTCSMCTRSVEMSISRLDFVDSVSMSLEETEGRVFLKSEAVIDFKKIAKAVVDAGFSVRFIRVGFNFDDVPVDQDGFFTWQNKSFQWLQFKSSVAEGDVALKLVDEYFLPRKENLEWKKKIGNTKAQANQNIFHVVQEF